MDSHKNDFEKPSQNGFGQYSKEEYIQYKREERAELGDRANNMIEQILNSPERLSEYLDKQLELGKSPVNTALIMDKMPSASMVRTFDEWQQKDRLADQRDSIRFIKKSAKGKGIKYFEADGEYVRADGTVAANYKVVHGFDINQTYGAPIDKSKPQYPEHRVLFKAITTKMLIPAKLDDFISHEQAAVLENGVIHIAKGLKDGGRLCARLTEEYAKGIADGGDHEKDAFIGKCAAYQICNRFGIQAPTLDRIPDSIKTMEIGDKRDLLSKIVDISQKLTERFHGNLMVQRYNDRQKQQQPSR